ncbi:3233_t:CDS:2, partial [Entrophospora sp. SA101]
MKFNQAYTYLIQQLPPSLVEEAWRRLTTRKRNPFTLLEACGIDPAIEDFLQHEIIVYNRKKERQRRKRKNKMDTTNLTVENIELKTRVVKLEQKQSQTDDDAKGIIPTFQSKKILSKKQNNPAHDHETK